MKILITSVVLILPILVNAQTPRIAPPDSQDFVNPFSGNKEATLKLCSVCHGETGKGDETA